jgi:hypothetical protein
VKGEWRGGIPGRLKGVEGVSLTDRDLSSR